MMRGNGKLHKRCNLWRSIRVVLIFLLALPQLGYGSQSVLNQNDVKFIQLSPDGKHFALLKRQAGGDALYIVNVTGKNVTARRAPQAPERIHSLAWLDGQHLALQIGQDKRYEQEPSRSGTIEILYLDGESSFYGDATKVSVREALTGKPLVLVDGLPRLQGVMLVTAEESQGLWLLDIRSDTVESLQYPPLHSAIFRVSADARFLTATGVTTDGSRRVLHLRRGADAKWRELDAELEIVSVDTSGNAYAYKRNDSGMKGLLSVAMGSGNTKVLFQNDAVDADQILFDSFGEPVAVRYVTGVPGWFYLKDAHRLANTHKSLRSSMPDNDVLVVSSSLDDSIIIAEIVSDTGPSSYFLLDAGTGQNQRLLGSQRGLSVVGGEEETVYSLRPFDTSTADGAGASGYLSVPQDGSDSSKPTVVMLRDNSASTRWDWEFNEEVWFFNRQGFNVLMLHAREAGVVTDVAEALRWMDQNDLLEKNRICLYGRGSAAQTALQAAFESESYDCVISMGGKFDALDPILASASVLNSSKRVVKLLFIDGADEAKPNVESRDRLIGSLQSPNFEIEMMLIANEKMMFSDPNNEIRAFARSSSFLKRNIGHKKKWPTLPLTNEQSLFMNELLEAFSSRAEEGFYNSRQWRRWFGKNDDDLRESLSDEQLVLYEAYQVELIILRRDPDFQNRNRPMGSAFRNSSR